VRNRENVDPFYIQGWHRGKFYPNFVAMMEKGNMGPKLSPVTLNPFKFPVGRILT
jgi:hypothetical protein